MRIPDCSTLPPDFMMNGSLIEGAPGKLHIGGIEALESVRGFSDVRDWTVISMMSVRFNGEAVGRIHELGERHLILEANVDTRSGKDKDWEQMSKGFEKGFALIDAAFEEGRKVLLHCEHGVSRSVAFAHAYLNRRHNMPLFRASWVIIGSRPCAQHVGRMFFRPHLEALAEQRKD